jgi:hypothetical protein
MSAIEGWRSILDNDRVAGTIPDLVTVLRCDGHLDELVAQVTAEVTADLRTDVPRAGHAGKLGRALELIEAGADKATVISATSRRTFYRARQVCQVCQDTPSHPSACVAHG